MMHCHIAQHAVMGMNTVWLFGTPNQVLRRFGREVPYSAGYLDFKGSAYGAPGRDPTVYHYPEPSDPAAAAAAAASQAP